MSDFPDTYQKNHFGLRPPDMCCIKDKSFRAVASMSSQHTIARVRIQDDLSIAHSKWSFRDFSFLFMTYSLLVSIHRFVTHYPEAERNDDETNDSKHSFGHSDAIFLPTEKIVPPFLFSPLAIVVSLFAEGRRIDPGRKKDLDWSGRD
jgi:hypothetical protein